LEFRDISRVSEAITAKRHPYSGVDKQVATVRTHRCHEDAKYFEATPSVRLSVRESVTL